VLGRLINTKKESKKKTNKKTNEGKGVTLKRES